MTTEQWFEKATAYFGGTMSAEEAGVFEKETADSEELSQLMQLWKDTEAAAALYERYRDDANAFITTHQKLRAEFIDNQQTNKFSPGTNNPPAIKLKSPVWKWVAMAAAITGIVFMIKLLSPSAKPDIPVAKHTIDADSTKPVIPPDNSITAAEENKQKEKSVNQAANDKKQYATLYAEVFVPDDTPGNQNGPLQDAFFFYANAQYKEAIEAIDDTNSEVPTRGDETPTPLTNFYALYYKGLSMMALRNTAGAIPVLQQALLQSPAEGLKAKAQWYLALAYIKEEKITSAITTLQSLINNPAADTYKNKAEKLLAALKK